jgi:AcrR family transcriptional regulator
MPDESSEPELPRAVALAWGVAANPQRGPKRELSIEGIVEVAVQLADAGGLAAVSMAAVASELGFTPMSLYRYISAKDDLVLLMQESGIGVPPETIREADGWRAGLRVWANEQLACYLEHPWLLDIPIASLPITPNNLAWFDVALLTLSTTPLSYNDRTSVVLAIEAQSRWAATIRRGYADAAVADPDSRDAAVLAALVTPEEFPEVAAAMRAGAFAPRGGDPTVVEDPFAFGLERVLDGVEAFLAGRTGTGSPVAVDALTDAASRDQKYREAVKSRREVEKKLREARKREAELLKAARERLAR